MFRKLSIIMAGILALIVAGTLSYISLEQMMGPREAVHVQEMPVVKTPAKTGGSLVPKTATVQKTVVAPGPLRAVAQAPTTSDLTIKGVIEYTNIARAQNGGLPALTENYVLGLDAQMKLSDMFTKQYFEHVSPTGVGPADLAKTVGYAYVVVGENLALGDFGSDQGVVTAWMNSPGHRANILNAHYQEIGVAVGKGMYEVGSISKCNTW